MYACYSKFYKYLEMSSSYGKIEIYTDITVNKAKEIAREKNLNKYFKTVK